MNNLLDKNFMICVDIILHSYGEDKKDFELIDIDFPEKYSVTDEMVENDIHCAMRLESLQECAVEEVCEYGDFTPWLHKQLWILYGVEQSYRVRIGFNFFDKVDIFTGEVDTDVVFEFNILEENVDITNYL